MNPIRQITIAAKDDLFDKLFGASTHAVSLGSADEEAAYERRDSELRRRTVQAVDRVFSPAFAKQHIDISWSWWPNHTRYIDASIDSFSQEFFDELRALLVDEYAGWRIQVVVYADPRDGKSMIGSLAIWADRLLIDRALYGLLKWRGIDLRCESEPLWKKAIDD